MTCIAVDDVVTPRAQNPTAEISQPCLNQRFPTVMLQGQTNTVMDSHRDRQAALSFFKKAHLLGDSAANILMGQLGSGCKVEHRRSLECAESVKGVSLHKARSSASAPVET